MSNKTHYIESNEVENFIFRLLSLPHLKDIVKEYEKISIQDKLKYRADFMKANFNLHTIENVNNQ